MREALSLIWTALVGLLRSPASLAAEILVLRHQINILRRHSPKRQTFSAMDRLIFAGLYRWTPTVLNALAIVKPETTAAAFPFRVRNRPLREWRPRKADIRRSPDVCGVPEPVFARAVRAVGPR